MASDASKLLKKLLEEYPYLEQRGHMFYPQVEELKHLIASGARGACQDKIARIEGEVDMELQTLAAAFKRFCTPGTNSMTKDGVKFMSDYLGFPSEDKDIEKTLRAMDTDRSGTISFDEFQQYVGYMGGSLMLYEAKHKQLALVGSRENRPELLRSSLSQAGIDEDAQASWRLVAPPSEFSEASKLVPCQRHALAHIRRLAKSNHERRLPELQAKVHRLGYSDNDLWMALAYIRELAPIIVHVDLDKMVEFMEQDTHYRNQFETKRSGGLLEPDVRVRWEKDLFGD
eukprot:2490047-Amphidinium_carterae.1